MSTSISNLLIARRNLKISQGNIAAVLAANAGYINPVRNNGKSNLALRKTRIRCYSLYTCNIQKHQQQQKQQINHYDNHYFKCNHYSSSSSFLNTHSNNNDETTKNNMTGSDFHKIYQEQIQELEQERTVLFGDETDTTPDGGVGGGDNGNGNDLQKSIDQLNREREELYDFTTEEKVAWGNMNTANNFGAHSSGLMNAIHKAKEAKTLYEDEIRRETASRVNKMVQGISTNMDSDNNNDVTSVIDENNPIFTHLNKSAEEVSMVDVGDKDISKRTAVARSSVLFPSEVMNAFGLAHESHNDTNEVVGPKGPIFATARLAGIMGAKRTSDLIPLCHPLPLSKVHVEIKLEGNRAIIECECRVTHKTGVEMEALAGATIAALTIYDMVKAVSHNVRIESTYLVKKSGGK